MPRLPRWLRSRSVKEKGAADPEEQVKALQAALVASRAVTEREKHWLWVTVAALVLVVGFVLVVHRDQLMRTIGGLIPGSNTGQSVRSIDAAYAAYRSRDDETALKMSRPLAEQGIVRAQTLLGLVYTRGYAVQQDETEAAKWFRRAAEQGDATAQLQLGIMYADGRGVPQNFSEAAKWYRLAAEQSNAQAQYNLGVLYVRGEGVPVNNVMAHMWFNLAAAYFPASELLSRKVAAANRESVAQKMTREEIEKAQQMAREWSTE